MRTMFDGVRADAAAIRQAFPDAQMVAGYIDGDEAQVWTEADWALFGPQVTKVQISRVAANGIGDVLDVEPLLATPGQAGAWIAARKHAGYSRPTIYCPLSLVPEVRTATGSYILGRDYDIWEAHFDGLSSADPVPGLPTARFAAKQYQARQQWDVSAVFDDGWPHRKPPADVPSWGATAWEYANVSWGPIGRDVVIQVRDAAGKVVVSEQVNPGGHWQTPGFPPGEHEMRLSFPGGAWTEWVKL